MRSSESGITPCPYFRARRGHRGASFRLVLMLGHGIPLALTTEAILPPRGGPVNNLFIFSVTWIWMRNRMETVNHVLAKERREP
jgi:hypothetical protein